MNKFVKIGSCALIAAMWTAAASATPPIITTSVGPFNFPIVDCGDFEVWTRGDEKVTEKLYFDRNGVPVKIQFKFHILTSEYYNFSFQEINISQGANGVGENVTINFNPVTGDIHSSGAALRLTIPGIGHVVMQVGNFNLDAEGNFVFHGLDFVFAEGETGLALCEALAP